MNGVAGFIDTPWTADWAAIRATSSGGLPYDARVALEDVAEAAMALATSTYLTGEVLTLDGGLNLVKSTSSLLALLRLADSGGLIVAPPSHAMSWPVVNEASSEAR